MPTIAGFEKLASVTEEQITEKIGRRVISGKQGSMVYWRMKAGAHAAAHQHPQEQFVCQVRAPDIDEKIISDPEPKASSAAKC